LTVCRLNLMGQISRDGAAIVKPPRRGGWRSMFRSSRSCCDGPQRPRRKYCPERLGAFANVFPDIRKDDYDANDHGSGRHPKKPGGLDHKGEREEL
jgi:hypothetical protein